MQTALIIIGYDIFKHIFFCFFCFFGGGKVGRVKALQLKIHP